MLIQIETGTPVDQDQITVSINGRPIAAKFTNTHIEIETTIEFGLHKLVIESHSDKRIYIQAATVDHCNLRKLFYLAWSELANGDRLQPCNKIWEPGQRWILPFGYPVSDWINKVESKFKNNVLGKDLYKDHWIWYPECIELDANTPKIIREFFQHNFDFTVVSKNDWTYEQIPFIKYNQHVEQQLIQAAHEELSNKKDLIRQLNKNPDQQKYNSQEFGYTNDQQWQVLLLERQASQGLSAIAARYREHFPACWAVIDSLNVPYWYAFIGIMPPKSIVYPHRDDQPFFDTNYKSYRGCTQLYVPLYWPDHSYIKLANAGAFGSDSGIVIINNDNFTHAAVNNSNEYRYMLALRTTHDQISKFAITC